MPIDAARLSAVRGGRRISAFVPDLGADTIVAYAFDESRGTLEPRSSSLVRVAPGSGPRHLKFHPNGRFVYVITEIANTVIAFACDAVSGTLSELQTIATLQEPQGDDRAAADLLVHPTGDFLYCSNRIEQTIAVFTIDQRTGLLRAAGHVATGGKFPRSLTLDPSGRFLLAGNEYSGTVNAYRVDVESGTLEPNGRVCVTPGPACLHGQAPSRRTYSAYVSAGRRYRPRRTLACRRCVRRAASAPSTQEPERSLFVSRVCSRARLSGVGRVGVALVSGPGVTSPKSRPSGCRAGHAGLWSRSRLSSRARCSQGRVSATSWR